MTAVKGRIKKALNKIEPAIDKLAKYDETTTPALVMNMLAVEIQEYDERLTKELKTIEDITAMLSDEIATANTNDMETSQEDQIA